MTDKDYNYCQGYNKGYKDAKDESRKALDETINEIEKYKNNCTEDARKAIDLCLGIIEKNLQNEWR